MVGAVPAVERPGLDEGGHQGDAKLARDVVVAQPGVAQGIGALLALGTLLLLGVGAGSGYGAVWWPFVIIGLGYGLLSTPMAAACSARSPASAPAWRRRPTSPPG
jgi:amino acid transporter